jgi:hypothetical protein
MARKTAIRITNAELRAEEFKADARKDIVPVVRTGDIKSGLPTLADFRADRNMLPAGVLRPDGTLDMRADSLLRRANSAASLELRGANYSTEDRADVAATIVADVLALAGGLKLAPENARPSTDKNSGISADSPKVTLTALCDRAKTLRRSIDRQRQHDCAGEKVAREKRALQPAALGIKPDDTTAKHAAILGRASVAVARRATDSVFRDLFKLADDGEVDRGKPSWATLYQWVRGETAEVCAAENGVELSAWKMRANRGGKTIRETWTSAELAARLTLGATDKQVIGTTLPDEYVCAGADSAHAYTDLHGDVVHGPADVLTFCIGDHSGSWGHGKTGAGAQLRELAADGRITADENGRYRKRTYPELVRPTTADEARDLCTVTEGRKVYSCQPSPAMLLQRRADSLRRMRAAYARMAKGQPRGVSEISDLRRSLA